MTKEVVLSKESSSLLTILQGAVARLDTLIAILDEAVGEDRAGNSSSQVFHAIEDTRYFIEELGVAGAYNFVLLKVQRPLSTNADVPHLLVYSEDRSVSCEITFDDQEIMDWFGGDYKMYVKARFWCDGVIQLLSRADDQPW